MVGELRARRADHQPPGPLRHAPRVTYHLHAPRLSRVQLNPWTKDRLAGQQDWYASLGGNYKGYMCCTTLHEQAGSYSSPYRYHREWLLVNFMWVVSDTLVAPRPNARSVAKTLLSKTERRAAECRRRA